jgi:hypothetical protein
MNAEQGVAYLENLARRRAADFRESGFLPVAMWIASRAQRPAQLASSALCIVCGTNSTSRRSRQVVVGTVMSH